jgi:flagellar protein FliS
MVQTGHNAYKQNVGNTIISKEQLLLKLYTGSLNFLKLAKRGMEENNPRVKGENITKVLNIITELDCALDMDKGGEMAENLSNLYRHILYSLVNANLQNDIETLDNVSNIILEIKSGFEEVLNQTEAEKRVIQQSAIAPKGGMQLAI